MPESKVEFLIIFCAATALKSTAGIAEAMIVTAETAAAKRLNICFLIIFPLSICTINTNRCIDFIVKLYHQLERRYTILLTKMVKS